MTKITPRVCLASEVPGAWAGDWLSITKNGTTAHRDRDAAYRLLHQHHPELITEHPPCQMLSGTTPLGHSIVKLFYFEDMTVRTTRLPNGEYSAIDDDNYDLGSTCGLGRSQFDAIADLAEQMRERGLLEIEP